MTQVIDRSGKGREYHAPTLRQSLLESCYSVRAPEGMAATIATRVIEYVERWLEDKAHVTSNDIRRKAAEHLAVHHPEAAYLYQYHHDIV